MRKLFGILLFMLGSLFAWAQQTITVPLKPIHKQGRQYFYDGKRMYSPYAIQVPLQSLNDREINRYFNQFRGFQQARGLAYLPSLIFLFTNESNSQDASRVFLLLLAGGFAADIGLSIASHTRLSKAINLYNFAIMDRASIGLNLDRLPANNQYMVSFGLKKRL